MTKKCAERLGLERLIDTRFTGVAAGVGQATIYGKIHSGNLSMNESSLNLQCAFTVLDHMEQPEMLLGLDMMRRFQACIDLENNVLKIHGCQVPFLAEADIPANTIVPQLAAASSPPASTSTTHAPNPTGGQRLGSSAAVTAPRPTQVKEEDIDSILRLVPSMTRENARDAILKAGGNVDLAAALLLGL